MNDILAQINTKKKIQIEKRVVLVKGGGDDKIITQSLN